MYSKMTNKESDLELVELLKKLKDNFGVDFTEEQITQIAQIQSSTEKSKELNRAISGLSDDAITIFILGFLNDKVDHLKAITLLKDLTDGDKGFANLTKFLARAYDVFNNRTPIESFFRLIDKYFKSIDIDINSMKEIDFKELKKIIENYNNQNKKGNDNE